MKGIKVLFVLACTVCIAIGSFAESFQSLVGNVAVGEVKGTAEVQVPFITWGGDMATFYANGGLKTQKGSIFDQQGLNIKLVPGDDFVQQVRDYTSGKSPFLRGTFRMIGLASEVLGSDPRTKGYVIFQMTYSAGDHAVARDQIKTLKDLKGATICLQKPGPHLGMLDDLLKDAGLKWDDIKVVWAKDLTGSDDSPAAIFRKNPSVDVCFVITPDMLGLCGGLRNIGSGAEGTVKGAHVLASTAERSKTIADVYVCRKDWYDANRQWVEKFTAGYLKACEDVIELKKQYESKGNKEYMKLLQMTQDIYGKDVIPTLENDAHGLLLDCAFVGHPGNVEFFTKKNGLGGFEEFQNNSLDLAVKLGFAKVRAGLFPSPIDWNSKAFIGYLTKTGVAKQDKFRAEAVLSEIEALNAGGSLDQNTIYEFSIEFQANQTDFSAKQYGVEFKKVVELAYKYGNAVIVIRGHSDPTKTLLDMVTAGQSKGILKKVGTSGNYQYYLDGRPLSLESTAEVVKLIESGAFDGATVSPRTTMQAALNLSRQRAEAVRDAIVSYASGQGLELDKSQIQPLGVGVREPIVPKPHNEAEAQKNMRVEFRLLRVSAETMNPSDFDF